MEDIMELPQISSAVPPAVPLDLTEENINPNIRRMHYIVGGTLAPRAEEIEREIAAGKKFPFTDLIKGHVGDLQAEGQKPITFFKQVISLVLYEELLNSTNYPSDVKKRAKEILDQCESRSSGAYTDTVGLELVRQHVAEYITKRDGVVAAKKEHIILAAGTANGARVFFKLFADQCKPNVAGVMFGIPLYALLAGSAAENGIYKMGFYMNESKDWDIELDELNRAYEKGRFFCVPRAIFIVNPHNPTGQVMKRDNMELVIKFAHSKKLLVFADEVYQNHAYIKERPFLSFRKVMYEMGSPYDKTQLISIYSTSKGHMGEAGMRSGFIELLNLDQELRSLIERSISTTLMPSVLGQAMMSCVTKPPVPGDPSYNLFMEEKTKSFNSQARRAKIVRDALNGIDGISCTPFFGSITVFPNVVIPPKAIRAARDKGQTPDFFYLSELLENAGVVLIPGSDFQERRNTYHFRISNIQQPAELDRMLDRIKTFHAQFLKKYQ